MYTKVQLGMTAKRRRRSVSQFEKTQEWQMMRADLEKGVAPGEALQVLLTEKDKERYGIRTRISVARFVKKYLFAHNLPYRVQSFRRDEGDYVIVQRKR